MMTKEAFSPGVETEIKPNTDKPTRKQKLGRVAAILMLTAGAMIGEQLTEVPGRAEQNIENRKKALEEELRTTFVGPVVLTSAKLITNLETDLPQDQGNAQGARARVDIHINGSKVNEKVANSVDTPTYYIDPNPRETLRMPNGTEISGMIDWKDKEAGIASMYPLLTMYNSDKPVTRDYKIELIASGALFPDIIEGAHNAGTVKITGHNGRITDVDILPRDSDAVVVSRQ